MEPWQWTLQDGTWRAAVPRCVRGLRLGACIPRDWEALPHFVRGTHWSVTALRDGAPVLLLLGVSQGSVQAQGDTLIVRTRADWDGEIRAAVEDVLTRLCVVALLKAHAEDGGRAADAAEALRRLGAAPCDDMRAACAQWSSRLGDALFVMYGRVPPLPSADSTAAADAAPSNAAVVTWRSPPAVTTDANGVVWARIQGTMPPRPPSPWLNPLDEVHREPAALQRLAAAVWEVAGTNEGDSCVASRCLPDGGLHLHGRLGTSRFGVYAFACGVCWAYARSGDASVTAAASAAAATAGGAQAAPPLQPSVLQAVAWLAAVVLARDADEHALAGPRAARVLQAEGVTTDTPPAELRRWAAARIGSLDAYTRAFARRWNVGALAAVRAAAAAARGGTFFVWQSTLSSLRPLWVTLGGGGSSSTSHIRVLRTPLVDGPDMYAAAPWGRGVLTEALLRGPYGITHTFATHAEALAWLAREAGVS